MTAFARRAAVMVLLGAAGISLGQILPTQPPLVQSVSGGAEAPPPPPRWPHRDRAKPIALTLSAQAPAMPALRYALLPMAEERQKGNAAVKYLEATSALQGTTYSYELIDPARNDAPLTELNEEEPAFQEMLRQYAQPLRFVREGARLDSADWETNLRQSNGDFILPSLSPLRQLGSILQLEARFDIKRHDWPAARDKLCTGFALARHFGQGETLIESLVGLSIANGMSQDLEDWVTEPGAPNLYWALSSFPVPFNDLRRPLENERALAFYALPELREFKEGHYSADGWVRMITSYRRLMTGLSSAVELPAGQGEAESQAAAALAGVAMYPKAKRYLVSRGMPAEQVEKMSVPEALERWFAQSYEEDLDEQYKWLFMPVYEAKDGPSAAAKAFEARKASGEANFVAAQLIASLGTARTRAIIVDRQIEMLRVVETIRAYAAEKGGLPQTLAALTLPAPMDPATNEPFGYALKDGGTVAELNGTGKTPREALKYVLTLRK